MFVYDYMISLVMFLFTYNIYTKYQGSNIKRTIKFENDKYVVNRVTEIWIHHKLLIKENVFRTKTFVNDSLKRSFGCLALRLLAVHYTFYTAVMRQIY